jgi:hypothetical protein
MEFLPATSNLFSQINERRQWQDKIRISESGKEESALKELFKWFSQKKPQLFLETIPDFDRVKVLSIAQSGKLASLSKLADSKITSDDLNTISSKI